MKKLILIITVLVGAMFSGYSQPQMMNYQGVARDVFGDPISNTEISLKINVISGSTDGAIIYSEIHQTQTSKLGIFNLHIGAGQPTLGIFTDIIWAQANHFVKLELDIKGGYDFKEMGTTQLLSVPYAFHAQTAGSIVNESDIMLKAAKIGVPSQTWSLFGNRKTDPEKDKFGTTDNNDLVFVTNNIERLRITADGQLITPDGSGLELGGSLIVHGDRVDVDKDIYVGRNVYLNTNDAFSPRGQTINYGTFTVEGKTFLNSELSVEKFVLFKDGFQLNGNASFQSNLNLLGDFKINGNMFTVESATGNTDIAGTLHVGGKSSLKSDLAVGGNSDFTGTLIVGGNTNLKSNANVAGNFEVAGKSNLMSDLDVGGNTNIDGELKVKGNSTFSNLKISGPGILHGEHVAVFENTNGENADGIAIKINKAETTDANNFITFYRKDAVAGRIEGYHHNYGDVPVIVTDVIEPFIKANGDFFKNTFGFNNPVNLEFLTWSIGSLPILQPGTWPEVKDKKWDGKFAELENGSWPTLEPGKLPTLKIEMNKLNTSITDIIQPWNWFDPNWDNIKSTTDNPIYLLFEEDYENDWKSLTDMGITELFIKTAEMELEAKIKSEGITYGSKGADYAEWLQRANQEDNLELGQVVGVIGGKISLNTENADQILVISSKPIVLGNMPETGEEALYEKVAFMGQVPTWVIGNVSEGDYIIASGKNDGTGIAKAPENIKIEDIKRIVGKAWSASSNSTLSLINVAIGLNRNDIANLVLKQQDELEKMENRLTELEKMISSLAGAAKQN